MGRRRSSCAAGRAMATMEERDSRSRFFALWRFLLGLLMTLMGRLGNVPMTRSGSSSDEGAMILTRASTFFFFSSTSEMKSCFPTQRPM